jgi:hypothetical protein
MQVFKEVKRQRTRAIEQQDIAPLQVKKIARYQFHEQCVEPDTHVGGDRMVGFQDLTDVA